MIPRLLMGALVVLGTGFAASCERQQTEFSEANFIECSRTIQLAYRAVDATHGDANLDERIGAIGDLQKTLLQSWSRRRGLSIDVANTQDLDANQFLASALGRVKLSEGEVLAVQEQSARNPEAWNDYVAKAKACHGELVTS